MKPCAHRSERIRVLFMLTLLLGIGAIVQAQANNITYGAGSPTPEIGGHYYLDTVSHLAYYATVTRWMPLDELGDIHEIEYWGGLLVVKATWGCKVLFAPGEELARVRSTVCESGLLIVFQDDFVHVLARQGRNMTSLLRDPGTYLDLGEPQQIAGRRAYCLPGPLPLAGAQPIDELRNWGMIREDGNWIVPAVFDAPFRFQNGIAEVLHYGKQRKINEKGEFVE